MPKSAHSGPLRSVSEAAFPLNNAETSPEKLHDKNPRDFLTISDTSMDTQDESTFRSLSALETPSLGSTFDGETINPDSYGSRDDAANPEAEWIIVGQFDHPLTEATGDGDEVLLEKDTSVLTDAESVDLDFDKQKKFAKIHIQRRLKGIKRYLEDMEFCDLSLQFGTSTTPVHAIMFEMHEGFRARFSGLLGEETGGKGKSTGKTRQLDVYGQVTVPAFAAVINFVYEGQCQVREFLFLFLFWFN